MLLRSYDHPRTHETHEGYNFVRRKAMTIDEICANETAGPPKPSFAMHRDGLSFDRDHLVGKSDEFSDHRHRGARAIIKNHIQVLYIKSLEVGRRVKLRIQSDNEADVTPLEVNQYIFEWRGQTRFLDLLNCFGKTVPQG